MSEEQAREIEYLRHQLKEMRAAFDRHDERLCAMQTELNALRDLCDNIPNVGDVFDRRDAEKITTLRDAARKARK